jgi:hypothetical protein
MKGFLNFLASLDWNSVGQFFALMTTKAKKSHGLKILKNRSVDSFGVGVGLVMAGWWVIQFSGLPKPLQDFVDTGATISEFRSALARVERNTTLSNQQLVDLSIDFERDKDSDDRIHRDLYRKLKNGYSD